MRGLWIFYTIILRLIDQVDNFERNINKILFKWKIQVWQEKKMDIDQEYQLTREEQFRELIDGKFSIILFLC